MTARAAEVLAAGGEVWVGDETALREFPPLRAAWARRGTQALVEITGRNARRVLHGALNVATGETVAVVRPRSRGEDAATGLDPLAASSPAGRAQAARVGQRTPAPHARRARRGRGGGN